MTAALALLLLLPSPLIERLGHRSYKVRAAAHHSLAAMGRLALPQLERSAREHPDCEVRERCACLLRPYAYEIAEHRARQIKPTRWPRIPWLALYDGRMMEFLAKSRHRLPLERLGAPNWREYREATLLWLRSQLLQRRPVAEIVEELDRMATEERAWISANGKNYNPPIPMPKGY